MSTTLELYEKLKPKLEDAEACSLLEIIESRVERRAATKEDLALLEERMKGEFEVKLAELKSDLVKWTFGFWVGTIAVLAGIMVTLLKTMK